MLNFSWVCYNFWACKFSPKVSCDEGFGQIEPRESIFQTLFVNMVSPVIPETFVVILITLCKVSLFFTSSFLLLTHQTSNFKYGQKFTCLITTLNSPASTCHETSLVLNTGVEKLHWIQFANNRSSSLWWSYMKPQRLSSHPSLQIPVVCMSYFHWLSKCCQC